MPRGLVMTQVCSIGTSERHEWGDALLFSPFTEQQ